MRKLFIVVLLLSLMVLFSGCGLMAAASVHDELIENVLNSINEGDYTEYQDSFVDDIASSDDFFPAMKEIDEYCQGNITEFKRTNFSINTSVSVGGKSTTTTDLTYSIITTEDEYILDVTMYGEGKDPDMKILNFIINLAPDNAGVF